LPVTDSITALSPKNAPASPPSDFDEKNKHSTHCQLLIVALGSIITMRSEISIPLSEILNERRHSFPGERCRKLQTQRMRRAFREEAQPDALALNLDLSVQDKVQLGT
jgi:ribosomal protein L34E